MVWLTPADEPKFLCLHPMVIPALSLLHGQRALAVRLNPHHCPPGILDTIPFFKNITKYAKF